MLVAILVILTLIIGTVPSGYFLHLDTSNQNVAALSLIRGCFEYSSEKMWTVLVLAGTYGIFGANPQYEIVLHLLHTVASCVLIYRITTTLTKDEWGGVLAIGLCLALPAFQYFTRTYWSYAVPLILLTMWFAIRRKYVIAGLATSLTLLAHFSSLAPLGLLWLYLFYELFQQRDWQTFLKCCVAVLAPIVVVELLFLLYYGPESPLLWTFGTLNALTNHSDAAYQPNPLWFPQGVIGSNGGVRSLLLGVAFASLWFLRGNPRLQKVALLGLGSAVFYWVQGTLGRGTLFTKAFTLLYPFWSILVAYVAVELWKSIRKNGLYVRLGAALIVWGLAFSTAFFIRDFTQTPQLLRAAVYQDYDYPILATAGSTIYNPAFYALLHQQETIYGTTPEEWPAFVAQSSPIIINSGASLKNTAMIAGYDLVTDVNLNKPAHNRFPVLNAEAGLDQTLEVWLPDTFAQDAHFQTESAKISPPGNLYSGSGCLSPKPYGNGTQYFYELVLDRLF